VVSSIARSTASGSTAVFSVPFPYLDKTHVQVRLNGVLKTLGVDYSFPTSSTIQITAGNPAAGVVVERKRVTPTDPLTDFSPGNLDTGDLNVGILQPLYLAQEGNDSAADILLRAWFTTSFGNGGTITVGPDGTILIWDASGNVVPGPSATVIQGYNDAAQAAMLAAQAAQAAAAVAKSASETARDNAYNWAQQSEDVAVNDGVHASGFSAYHWMRKALGYATSAAAVLAAITLPASPAANAFLQRDSGNTAYVSKTSTEVRNALAAAAFVTDRTAVKALDPTKDKAATTYGEGTGRNGTWVAYLTSALTAKDAAAATADTGEGAYFTSGLYTWVRQHSGPLQANWWGAIGDGTTVNTTAIQNAEAVRASLGGALAFRPGDYLTAGITVNRANGGSWLGQGNVRLLPNADSVVLMSVSGASISPTTAKVFSVEGLEFHFNSHASVTGYRESAPYYTLITKCKFNRLQFSCILTGPNSAAQTGWVNISDIYQVGEGSWLFQGFDDTRYIFNININNFNQQGTGAAPWTGVNALFHCQRAVSVYLNNVNAASLDGATKGVYMQGDCQGIFFNNVIIGWPTYGVHAVTWTDGGGTLKPAYVYMTNVGMDQPTVSGYDITGRTWRMHNCNATNGYQRSSTGPGINIQAAATDVTIRDSLSAYMNHDGVKVNVGATKVILAGVTAENNDQIVGGNFDVNLTSCASNDVIMEGRNYIGAKGVNATGQRVVNGTTSRTASKSNSAASTTAVTTQEDLKTYTIPASTLKPGQKVRLRAFGTTAANANTKTIRLWFGGNSIVDHSGAWSSTPWVITAEIDITAANAQTYSGIAVPTAVVPTARQGSLTVTDTAAIIVKATGQNGVATAGDITCNGFEVEIIT
jgi:hypothetical protein